MIKSPAIRHQDKTFVGLCHANIMIRMVREGSFDETLDFVEGFVTETGEFVNRSEAAVIAFNCGQIQNKKYNLFSVDIAEK